MWTVCWIIAYKTFSAPKQNLRDHDHCSVFLYIWSLNSFIAGNAVYFTIWTCWQVHSVTSQQKITHSIWWCCVLDIGIILFHASLFPLMLLRCVTTRILNGLLVLDPMLQSSVAWSGPFLCICALFFFSFSYSKNKIQLSWLPPALLGSSFWTVLMIVAWKWDWQHDWVNIPKQITRLKSCDKMFSKVWTLLNILVSASILHKHVTEWTIL